LFRIFPVSKCQDLEALANHWAQRASSIEISHIENHAKNEDCYDPPSDVKFGGTGEPHIENQCDKGINEHFPLKESLQKNGEYRGQYFEPDSNDHKRCDKQDEQNGNTFEFLAPSRLSSFWAQLDKRVAEQHTNHANQIDRVKPQKNVCRITRESHTRPIRKEALLFLCYFPLVFFAILLSDHTCGHPNIMILGSIVFILYGVGWGFLIGIRHLENQQS